MSSSSQPTSSSSSQSIASTSAGPVSSSSSHQTTLPAGDNIKAEECKHYLPFHRAILKGDLKYVSYLCDSDEHAVEARITLNLDTALHVAVETGRTNHIVEYLLKNMSKDKVALQNKKGNTALSIAAIVGNVEAAKKIMKERNLTDVSNNDGWVPLFEAARHGQRKMIKYLLQFSESYLQSVAETSSDNNPCVLYITLLIIAGFYDLALDLVNRHKSLATKQLSNGDSLLSAIAGKPSAFPSGKGRINYWKLIFPCFFPSYIKEIRERKLMHRKAVQLVKLLCKEITDNSEYKKASSILKQPLLLAAELGVCEVVEEIINLFPDAIWFTNEKNHNVFHLAVINRQEQIFNLIFQLSGHKHSLLISEEDTEGNTILHLAGKSAPQHQLNLIPGAALQMQRELQWFKEVEKIVQPRLKENKNSKTQKTPAMVFTEAHKDLVKDGEKWMKDSATSSSVVAALVATVVFAAVITIPGDYGDGNNNSSNNSTANNNGVRPNFYGQTAFTVFSVSDSLSLFSAIAAIIMFLSILTARYAEDDFLHTLPSRLTWGVVMLFFSLTSMMIASGAAIYLVLCGSNGFWIIVLVGGACLPLSMFVYSQFPLLKDLISSTYGSGIFHKRAQESSIK